MKVVPWSGFHEGGSVKGVPWRGVLWRGAVKGFPWRGCHEGGFHEGCPMDEPPVGKQKGSTHPTGMHSCFWMVTDYCIFSSHPQALRKTQFISYLSSQSVKGQHQNLYINWAWNRCELMWMAHFGGQWRENCMALFDLAIHGGWYNKNEGIPRKLCLILAISYLVHRSRSCLITHLGYSYFYVNRYKQLLWTNLHPWNIQSKPCAHVSTSAKQVILFQSPRYTYGDPLSVLKP